jgi:hypothetical protein
MPKIGDIYPSKYLKDSDLTTPLLLTIKRVTIEDVGRGSDRDTKPVIHFEETAKMLTVNKTNAKRVEKITGSDDTDNWPGKKIVVYWDPDIEFGGEIVGGVRIRAPRNPNEPEPGF